MSTAAAAPIGVGARLVQAAALAVVFAVPFAATRLVPDFSGSVGVVPAVGFLLLAGTLSSELLGIVGLPHLSGYLIAGIVGGPHVLGLVDHDTVERLSPSNTFALALIALAGGAELHASTLRRTLKSLAWATLTQNVGVLIAMSLTFAIVSRFIPFAQRLSPTALFGVALLWGVLAVSRSPSACMGILSQTRAKGPVATFSLGFVMSSDVVVVVLLAVTITLARPLIDPGGELSLKDFEVLGHELLGSVALGTTLGLALGVYLRLVGKQLLLVLVLLGFGMTEALNYIKFDPLLCFMSAGFVVQNLTSQGEKLLHAVEETGSIVFVVFFAIAGAHLDLPLLKATWPIAVTLSGVRALVTVLMARLGSRLAKDPPMIKKWGWCSLVSQAGLALGLSVVIERSFPQLGGGFRSLAIACIALNELFGPILFKLGLDRAGETTTTHGDELTLPPPEGGAPSHA